LENGTAWFGRQGTEKENLMNIFRGTMLPWWLKEIYILKFNKVKMKN
jgi:hypothetical protein